MLIGDERSSLFLPEDEEKGVKTANPTAML